MGMNYRMLDGERFPKGRFLTITTVALGDRAAGRGGGGPTRPGEAHYVRPLHGEHTRRRQR